MENIRIYQYSLEDRSWRKGKADAEESGQESFYGLLQALWEQLHLA